METEDRNDGRSGEGMSRMNRLIRCRCRLLRLCFLPTLMLFLTGCGAHSQSFLRWVTYSETGAPLDAKEVIAAANAYSKEKIGAAVSLEFQPTEKINLMMASGEYYDIVFTCSWVNDFDKNAEAGLYYDITDLVHIAVPGTNVRTREGESARRRRIRCCY